MLLDVVLIAEEGSSVCRAIRRHGGVPVIMLGDHTLIRTSAAGWRRSPVTP
jgi:DNA-binding response OmpR family regulator